MKTVSSFISAVLDSVILEEVEGQPQSLNLLQLKQIPSLQQAIATIESVLTWGGAEGQGRKVFKLEGRKVLKLAKNLAGVAQNEAEATVCRDEKNSSIFPKMFDFDPRYFWILVEEAEPMTRVKFESATNMPWREFLLSLAGAFMHKLAEPNNIKNQLYHASFEKNYGNPFLRRVINLINDCGYEPGDFAKLDSWGLIDGRVVVIDSGLTTNIYQGYYQ